MARTANTWTLLIYKIPSHPTRLRLQIWRRLQRMGGLYLQDAVCLLPSRPDLDENMQYIAESIGEMGGIYYLFSASASLPGTNESIQSGFRSLADTGFEAIATRLHEAREILAEAVSLSNLEQAEEVLKRERVAYLRARRLAYFGSEKETEIVEALDALRRALDHQYQNGK